MTCRFARAVFALVLAVGVCGCTHLAAGPASASTASVAHSDADSLANALQRELLLSGSSVPSAEPRGDVSLSRAGVYLANISAVTTSPASVTFDVLTADPSWRGDSFPAFNRYAHPQRAPILRDAVFVVQAPALGGPRYGASSAALCPMSLSEFERYIRPDPKNPGDLTGVFFWISVDGERGGVDAVAEAYTP